MTKHELLRRFPNASPSFLAANCYEERSISSKNRGDWIRTGFQKQQGDQRQSQVRKAVLKDAPQKEGVDGGVHRQFRVSVTFLVSDNRRRDPTGMLETIMDCLIHAVRNVRRQYPGVSPGGMDDPPGAARVRRSNHNH